MNPRASWDGVVKGMHSLFGVFVKLLVVFFAFKAATSTSLPVPFVPDGSKTRVDVMMCVFAAGWAMFYLLSLVSRGSNLRSRGFLIEKVMDSLSLLCALGLTSSLLCYITPHFAVMPSLADVGIVLVGAGYIHGF